METQGKVAYFYELLHMKQFGEQFRSCPKRFSRGVQGVAELEFWSKRLSLIANKLSKYSLYLI